MPYDSGKICVFHLLAVFLEEHGFTVEIGYFVKDSNKLFFDYRLENVVKAAVSDRPLGVCKIIVSGKKNESGIRDLLLLNGLKKFKAVHLRHLNVRDNEVNLILTKILQSFFSVGADGRDLKSAALPVNNDLESLKGIRFVINKHYF